jgi:hypothetical protein
MSTLGGHPVGLHGPALVVRGQKDPGATEGCLGISASGSHREPESGVFVVPSFLGGDALGQPVVGLGVRLAPALGFEGRIDTSEAFGGRTGRA